MRNKYTTLWIWLFVCPLALDYKGAEASSGHAAQFLLAALTLGAGLILVLIAPRFGRPSALRAIVTAALLLTVLGSFFTQLLQGNDFGNYLRVLLPFVLFLLGYLVACHPWRKERLKHFEKAMFWAMVMSLIFSFVYGMAISTDLDTVRFRIVSVTLLGLQGVLLHEMVVARRVTKFTMLLFLCTVVIELLSVTRSLIVGTLLLFVLAVWMSGYSARHLLRAVVRSVVLVALLGGVAVSAAAIFPEVAEHWTQRVFASKETTSGRDPTTITRLAEMKDQYDQVVSSPTSLLAGKGFGHFYHYSPDYLPYLAGQISRKDFFAIKEWAAGHNFWVYQLFAGGLIFGIGLPVAVLYALYCGVAAFRSWRRIRPDAPYLPIMGRSILLLAALLATSIGGNPLGPRFSGLVFGVALGLLVSMYSRLSLSIKRQPVKRSRRRTAGVVPSLTPTPVLGPPRPAPRLVGHVTHSAEGDDHMLPSA